MKTVLGCAAWVMAMGWFNGHAAAQGPSIQLGGVDLRANGAVSGQAGAFKDVGTGADGSSEDWDASIVLTAEKVTSRGLLIGLRAEFDTGGRVAEDLTRDEIYAYIAGGFGRLEIGEQDGAADSLSVHAPIIGLGQIRGDFARYTGDPALLSPLDTRDALKAVYLSPPWRGARFGVSFAPEFESNGDDPNPRRRTRQENAHEIALAYQRPVGPAVLSMSAAYVGGEADPITQRADLSSWSVGAQAARGPLAIGGAYVFRGDSNSLTRGLDEDEWNAGIAWRGARWGAAASASVTASTRLENRLIGAGAYYEISPWWVARADVVAIEERPARGEERDGQVGIIELSFRF